MTREEFINWFEERFALTKNDIYEFGQLYDKATQPQWISVEEIQPKKDEWFLGYSPLKSPLSSIKIDVYNFISFGQLEAHGITHWMPLPLPPKEGGEE